MIIEVKDKKEFHNKIASGSKGQVFTYVKDLIEGEVQPSKVRITHAYGCMILCTGESDAVTNEPVVFLGCKLVVDPI